MIHEFMTSVSTFWMVFSFSFLVALTGAMSPGPLLTYTIVKTANAPRRGYLTGLWVITGHALLEMGIITLLLLGFSFILKNTVVVRTIGTVGGIILVGFGGSILRDVLRGSISTDFLDSSAEGKTSAESAGKKQRLNNPVMGGVLISMANPYWWIWWATIGFAFMVQFDVSFSRWPTLLAFFIGHEAGDLIWYLIVSTLVFFGLKHLNRKVYTTILALCGGFMILFGVYLGLLPFFKSTV